jgi:hypothetical protein
MLLNILANTGTVSFWLYGIFIIMTIVAMVLAFYIIKKDIIKIDKLDKMVELFKYAIVSIALSTVGLIVANLFKEREQDVNELEYFDKYVQDVKKADGAEERWRLAKYLSIVAPSGEMKKSWENYYNYLDTGEHKHYLELQDSLLKTNSNDNLTRDQQQIQAKQIRETINMYEKPLTSANVSQTKPTIYIQYCDKDKKNLMLEIQNKFSSNFWNAPGIEYLETGCDNSIRYFHDEDRALADEANNLLDNKFDIKRSYIKAPNGQIELWVEN